MNTGLVITVVVGAITVASASGGLAYWVEHNKADKVQVASSINQERVRDYNSQMNQLGIWIRFFQDKKQQGTATSFELHELNRLIETRTLLQNEINNAHKK